MASPEPNTVVIVGAGLAGAKAAEALRDRDFAGRIVLIGAEDELPYERPPLSKGYLLGSAARDEAYVHPREWYRDHHIELRLGRTVTAINRESHSIDLDDGSQVSYGKLLLTTGSSNRSLELPGADAEGVFQFRTLPDSDALKDRLQKIGSLVIVGAGWIGLEIAAAARQADVAVTIVESVELPLLRVLGRTMAGVFRDLHVEHGVRFRFSASVSRIMTADGKVTGVELAGGEILPAEAVLLAVGVEPNTALAEAADLPVDHGIVADSGLRTADPDIFVAGDVAAAEHPFYGRRIHVEHWANALNQPVTAAAAMLDRKDESGSAAAEYGELPYFFTDQYDLGMEYIGLTEPGSVNDVVIRGNLAGREFVAFWMADDQVVAGMNVNVWDVVDDVKSLIRSRKRVDRAALADSGVALSELASAD